MAFWTLQQALRPRVRKLKAVVEHYLRIDLTDAQSLEHSVKPIQRVNLQRVLDRWTADARPAAELLGFSSTGYSTDDGFVKYLMRDELILAPIERTHLESGPGESLDCVSRGVYLFERKGLPVIVALIPPRFLTEESGLEVIAGTREVARETLTSLLTEAQKTSVYKGRTLSLEQSKGLHQGISLRFHEIRLTRREDIILPDDLIRVVERNVLGMLQHAEAMRAAGRSLRRGLLFHGPPGTGKTMMVRYLVQACKDHTAILLTGAEQALIREACQIARMLAPSIVVLEDVDLVAEDRDKNWTPTILLNLMNEMDGLGSREEITFLLTTNRPEVLEPALAGRPGRIDQAIAFPLPDEGCRRRLFDAYGKGLDLSRINIDRWVDQTNGVSPAFIEELLRKAALIAAERGESCQPMCLTELDVQAAIRELIYFGGELTQKLLGYRPSRIGYQAPQDK